MKQIKLLLLVVFAAFIAACGGGGGSAGSSGGGTSTTGSSAAAVVEVLTSATSVSSSGDEVLITAFVKNASNVSLAAQAVSFSASSGVLQVDSATTNSSGAVTARLTAGSDKSLRDIVVTVSSGSASGRITIPVVGTRLSLSGGPSLQAGSAASSYTVRAVDSAGNAVSGAEVVVQSTLGNGVSPARITTDGTGGAIFLYTPNTSGLDKVVVAALGATATLDITVSATDFTFLSPSSGSELAVGADQSVTVRIRSSGVGQGGRTVTFSTTRGQITAEAVTNGAGEATVLVRSATAGPAVVTAQIAGSGQISLPIQFVATTPANILLQVNPAAISPNRTGSVNRATIEATVRDAAGNAVANRQVNFSTLQDLSNGTLSPGVATTDANGRAAVQFIAGGNSTPAAGVVIKAQVASTTIEATTSLTVNGEALFISIGFGNEMSNLDQTTYEKEFSIYVTDVNGNAVGGQELTLSVIPNQYRKGVMRLSDKWGLYPPITLCSNEDANFNGVLDAGEDKNLNGQLTPGNVVVATPGKVTTGLDGRTSFKLRYGEQYALWLSVDIIARGSVGGTESRQKINFDLPILASDVSGDASPAGVVSPFGTSDSCLNSN